MAEKPGLTPEEGRIEDIDKAREMAYAEKPFREAADKAAEKAAAEYEAGRETYPATPALKYITSQLEVARTALEQKRESAEYSQWGEKPYRYEIERLGDVVKRINEKLRTTTGAIKERLRKAEIAGSPISVEEAVQQQVDYDYYKTNTSALEFRIFDYGMSAGHPDAQEEILKAFGVLKTQDKLSYLAAVPEKNADEPGRGRVIHRDKWFFTLPTQQESVNIKFEAYLPQETTRSGFTPEGLKIEITPELLTQEVAAHLEEK